MELHFDTYTRRARLYPALLVMAPAALAIGSWFPDMFTSFKVIWPLIGFSAVLYLLAQVGRDRGKRAEAALFARWGGKPTTRLLQRRNADHPNLSMRDRYHLLLTQIDPTLSLPTSEEERADPAAADAVYDLAVGLLRERTRDQKRFSLIFGENVSYGFRRNLWAMKWTGVSAAGAAVLAVVTRTVLGIALWGESPMRLPVPIVSFGIGVLLLFFWFLICRPDWVRVPAEGYAERLLGACEELAREARAAAAVNASGSASSGAKIDDSGSTPTGSRANAGSRVAQEEEGH